MNANMTNQSILEKCILKLVDEFLEEPFIFFNEAEAITRFHQILMDESALNHKIQTQDGHQISRIHREYPIPPFVEGISSGNYDTVILNQEYITINLVDHIARPGPNREPHKPKDGKSFLAVIEFKLLYEGLGGSRPKEIINDLNRLNLSANHSEFVYFVYLQRYLKKNLNLWNKNWPNIKEEAEKKNPVSSIVAIHWREFSERQNLYQFGHWLQHSAL